MFKKSMLLVSGLMAATSAALFGKSVAAVERMPDKTAYVPPMVGRGRHAGEPGRAGDKLARMAAEGRIGMRHGS